MAEAQTTAVDVWSLGLVALRLVTYEVESFGGFTRMSQQSLEEKVKTMIKGISPKRSSNSQRFVLACLQLAPMHRITAAEAECHDWFCTPKKHFKFFQRLDQRCRTNLDDSTHLTPMPWDLTTLQSLSCTSTPAKSSVICGASSTHMSSPPCVETSGYSKDAQKDVKMADLETPTGLLSPHHEPSALMPGVMLATTSPGKYLETSR